LVERKEQGAGDALVKNVGTGKPMNLMRTSQRAQHQRIHQAVLVISNKNRWGVRITKVLDALYAFNPVKSRDARSNQRERGSVSNVPLLDRWLVEGFGACRSSQFGKD